MKIGNNIDKAEIVHKIIQQRTIIIKLTEMHTQDKYSTGIMQQLPDEFEYSALKFW
jgi:hypothetical protein